MSSKLVSVSRYKRARIQNNEETNNQQDNPSINSSTGLLRYPFVIPNLIQYLDDCDVLCILLLIAKSMQHLLSGYQFKQPVPYETYETIVNTPQYLHVRINKVKNVTKLPLAVSLSIIHVELHENFNDPLTVGMFPVHLIYLKLNRYFDHPITPGVLPNTLQQLEFCCDSYFNHPLVIGSVPQSLTCLKLNRYFKQQIPIDVLPLSLTSLVVGSYDNVALNAGPLLTNLKSLVGVGAFRWDLNPGILPPSLEMLEVNIRMMRNVLRPGVFPSSLKRLSFFAYTGSLDVNVLPWGLTSLTLTGCYRPFVVGVLPDTLLELHFKDSYVRNIAVDVLPHHLKHLSLGGNAYFEPGALPATLEQLSMACMLEQPYDHELESAKRVSQTVIDTSRWSSEDERWDPQPVTAFMPYWLVDCNLTDLSFTVNPSHLIAGVFPLSLRCLNLKIRPANDVVDVSQLEYDGWTATPFPLTLLPGVIPPAVQNLKLQWYYGRNYCLLSGSLPNSVISVGLCNCVPSPNLLTTSVTHVQAGKCLWNQLIDVLARVPTSVTRLTLSEYLCPDPRIQTPPAEIDPEYRDNDEFRAQCSMPGSVTHLYIEPCYNPYVQFLTFPPHLVALHVGRGFPKYLQLALNVTTFFTQDCDGTCM